MRKSVVTAFSLSFGTKLSQQRAAYRMSENHLSFVPTLPRSLFCGNDVMQAVARRATLCKRRRVTYPRSMHFLDPVHNIPEFINHVVISCGIGLAGIAGAKATEGARALTAGDRKADHMDSLARDIDSMRRRRELADVDQERDWNDVGVDRYANVVVVPEVVPELESHDDLQAFDKLLMESPTARHSPSKTESGDVRKTLPEPTEFEFEDEE